MPTCDGFTVGGANPHTVLAWRRCGATPVAYLEVYDEWNRLVGYRRYYCGRHIGQAAEPCGGWRSVITLLKHESAGASMPVSKQDTLMRTEEVEP